MINELFKATNLELIEKLDLPLSSVVVCDNLAFVSGHASFDPKTGERKTGTFEEEARLTFSNIEQALASAGSALQYVLKVNVFLADIKQHYQSMNAIYRTIFKPPYPARTTVGADLGGLLIEVEVIARVVNKGEQEVAIGEL